MKTVKEVSNMTGVSVRTLHYYDEIGLLIPTVINEAGYRLYDDTALETLRRILFFKEFDLPLKEIKAIMDNPELEKNQILEGQRFALEQKKRRLERLLASIDGILKGETQMDFEAFEKEDVEKLFQIYIKNAPEHLLQTSIRNFGSMEEFHRNYVEKAYTLYNKPENRRILLEAYGEKEAVLESATHPMGKEELKAYQQETDAIIKQLVVYKREGFLADALEIKLLICKFALASRDAFRLKNEKQMMEGIADTYTDYGQIRAALEQQYGEPGIAEYLAEGIRSFYKG